MSARQSDWGTNRATLLAKTTISTGVTVAAAAAMLTGLAPADCITAYVQFLWGSGGTNVTVYLQTSFDGGATWVDIMCFQFLTAAATKVGQVNCYPAAGVAPAAVTDGGLAANTVLTGVIGDRLRVKWGSTGTYGGATSIQVDVVTG